MKPLTETEIQTEKRYRYEERLGILCGSNPPTSEQLRIASTEAAEWERDYRESLKAQRELL